MAGWAIFYYFNGVQYYLGRFIRGDVGNMRIFTKFLCRISDKHVENILRGYFTRIFYENILRSFFRNGFL